MPVRRGLDSLIHRLRRAAAGPADGATDAALVERFVARRDEAAFELLLWRHGPMVLSVCRRMLRCDEDAEDAFQAAFLLLARKASSIHRREAVAGWLYQTACRIALRARKAAKDRPVAVPPGTEPAAANSEPDILWRDLRPVLDEEVHRLPEKYRLAIILCYFQGRTHAEAGQELGCASGTVAVRLHRARELLRSRLARRGLALSAAALAVLAVERSASAAAPAALVHATLRASLLFAAGKAVTGAVSAQAAAWTQGVLKAMFLSKLKILAIVVLVVGAIGTGTGFLWLIRAASAQPAQWTPPRPVAVGQAADGKASADVPAEREGRLVLVGTEIKSGETIAAKDKVVVKVGFLAVDLGARNDAELKKLVPEKWWPDLDVAGTRAYARWKPGDPLPAGKLFVAWEERDYRKLHVGDAVAEDQLLALVDQGPALDDLRDRIDAETAEQDHVAAGNTKEEAGRRASQAEFLYQKGKGYISEDDYKAAMLNRDRYVAEEKAKDVGRRHAARAVLAAVDALKTCEIRSSDRGVVKEILKRRGEAIHNLEAVVRLEVQEVGAAPVNRPVPGTGLPIGPAIGPATPGTGLPGLPFVNIPVVNVPVVNVPGRDGVVLVIGTEIKEGEKVPADQVVTIKTDAGEQRYRRLKPGDMVEEGQLLARLDDRLQRLDVEVKESRLEAAKAELIAAVKNGEEADSRLQRLTKLLASAAVAQEEVSEAKQAVSRAQAEEQTKTAGVRETQTELKASLIVLEMYEIRSPVRGVVRSVGKDRGEAVKNLETVVQIEEKVKE